MSRFPLDVKSYMSTVLVVISPVQPLSEAIRLMRLHGVRHLPVLKKNKVVGVLSQRDVYRMQSIDHSSPSEVQVSEAMTADPYTVEPDEPIDRVSREMARRKIGTALITHGDRLLGMFTGSDALLALAALVEDGDIPDEPDERDGVAPPSRATARSKRAARKGSTSAASTRAKTAPNSARKKVRRNEPGARSVGSVRQPR